MSFIFLVPFVKNAAAQTTSAHAALATGRVLGEDKVWFRIDGYDDCFDCLTWGGAVYGTRIENPRTDQMKEDDITHDRYLYQDGDYCLPISVCDDTNDAMYPDQLCFKVKDKNRDTYPEQICSGYPYCNSDANCDEIETCFDGKLYPTTCGPNNCDAPIANTCSSSDSTSSTDSASSTDSNDSASDSNSSVDSTSSSDSNDSTPDSTATIQVDCEVSYAKLRSNGFTASELKVECGATANELQKAGYTTAELQAAGYTTMEVRAALFNRGLQVSVSGACKFTQGC